MDFIKEKIRVMVEKLGSLRTLSSSPISMTYADCPEYKTTNLPPENGWRPFREGERFTGIDTHFWLHLTTPTVELTDLFKNKTIPYGKILNINKQGI